jgi:hypothetical protein
VQRAAGAGRERRLQIILFLEFFGFAADFFIGDIDAKHVTSARAHIS